MKEFRRLRREHITEGGLPGEAYFELSAEAIFSLECMRRQNFQRLQAVLVDATQNDQLISKWFSELDLAVMARKIDYENICNRGLHNNAISETVKLMEIEEMLKIKDFAND